MPAKTTSLGPRLTSFNRADRSVGSTPAFLAHWAWERGSRWARLWCGPALRCGSSTATAHAATRFLEYDTFVRHGIPVIAVVGNDACWTQIAREQIPLLGDDVGVMLSRTAYHKVVEGFGAKGIMIDDEKDAPAVFAAAKEASAAGHPVLVNVHIGTTDFRKGSISI